MKRIIFVLIISLIVYFNKNASSSVPSFFIYLDEENCVHSEGTSKGITVMESRSLISKCLITSAELRCEHKDKKSGKVIDTDDFKIVELGDGISKATSEKGVFRLSFSKQFFSYHRTEFANFNNKLVTHVCTGTIF